MACCILIGSGYTAEQAMQLVVEADRPIPPLGTPGGASDVLSRKARRVIELQEYRQWRNSFRKNVHVIINPASGKDEPILNPINDVFGQYDIPWEGHITHHPGDATRLTMEALEAGADLIASYGGDGTLMEVINGMVGQRKYP